MGNLPQQHRGMGLGPSLLALCMGLAATSCTLIFDEVETGEGGGGEQPLRIFGSPSSSHYCLARGNQFLCWGNNSDGQLGLGHEEFHVGDDERADLVLEPIEMPDFITDIVMSEGHTCVETSALEMYCFGNGNNGALGFGDDRDRAEPITEAGRVRVGGNVRELGADIETTCILRDGAPLCWGLGSAPVHCALLGDCEGPDRGVAELPEELEAVPLSSTAETLFVGRKSACAILDTGAVQCWGENGSGQLGDGTESGVAVGQPAGAQHEFSTLALGSEFVCGLDAVRDVRCWGLGEDGQSGLASTEDIASADEAPSVGFERPVQKLVAGDEHICVKFQGAKEIQCWGTAFYGALGRGSSETLGDDERVGILAPLPIDGVVDIAAGRDSTCVILDTEEVVCWGLQSSLSEDNVGVLGAGQSCEELEGSDTNQCAYGDDPDETLDELPRMRFAI